MVQWFKQAVGEASDGENTRIGGRKNISFHNVGARKKISFSQHRSSKEHLLSATSELATETKDLETAPSATAEDLETRRPNGKPDGSRLRQSSSEKNVGASCLSLFRNSGSTDD